MIFNKIVCRIFSVVMIGILAFLTLISLLSTTYISESEIVFYVSDKPYIHFLVLLLLLGGLYLAKDKLKINEKISPKMVMLLGIAVTLGLAVYVIASMFYPRFDQRHVMNIAAQLLNKDYTEFKPGGYAEIYPYQNGILLLYEFFAFLFGANNAVAIQFMNLIFIVGAYVALYRSFRLLTEKYLYMMTACLLFLPLWGFVSFVYGNVPAFCFGTWALYFALLFQQVPKWYTAGAAAVCMMLSCVLKMNFMVLLITIIGIAVMAAMSKKDFRPVFMAVLMLVVVLAGDKGADLLIQKQTGLKATEGIPAISYVAMGLHEHIYRGAGWHDNYPENTYKKHNNNPDIVEDKAVDDIEKSLDTFDRHPQYMVGFFIRKIASMWNEPSYDSLSMQMERESLHKATPTWVNTLVKKGSVNSFVYQLMNLLQTLIMFGALIYFILRFKNENFTWNVFALFFLGGFLVHLLWEASSQYAIFYVMLLIPYMVIGYADLLKKLCHTPKRELVLTFSAAVAVIAVISIPELTEFLTLNRNDALYLEYLGQ